jgi:dTDP-4-dehydrorhamnose reductase
MKALILGANGQLGRALIATAPAGAQLTARTRAALDITDGAAVVAAIAEAGPDVVFNAAAYTAVDRAESEEQLALAINGTAVGHIARAARAAGARLVHVSTDFVFDGRAGTPYPPDAQTDPIGAYGRSKRAGEIAAGDGALIVRTAWVYGDHGANFVATMLRLMHAHGSVRVVADQLGTPTYAHGLAQALWALAAQDAQGFHHWTDSGAASWYDFAVAIAEEAHAIGLLAALPQVIPIDTQDFPTPARRPGYSVLDKRATFAALGGPAPHWRHQLRTMLRKVAAHG